MSTFKNYFDGIDTTADLSAECGEIIERASKIKKRRKVVSSGLGVTLAVMMTTTVAVSAAEGWSITEIIGRWFKGDTNSVMDNLSEVNILELEENNFGALEITPRGTIADDNVIVLFMDVTRTDGGVFDNTEYEVTDKDGNVLYDENGNAYKDVPWRSFGVAQARANISRTVRFEDEVSERVTEWDMDARQYEVDDGNPYDNKMTMAFCFDKTDIKEMIDASKDNPYTENMRLESMTLRLCNIKETRYTSELREGSGVYEGKTVHYSESYEYENLPLIWNAKLSFETSPVNNKTVEPNSGTTITVTDMGGMNHYDRIFAVTKISVSKFSLSFDLEAPVFDFWNMPVYYDISAIIMKNGDVIELTKERAIVRDMRSFTKHITYTGGDKSGTDLEHMTIILKDPIDPNDVKAVRIGDTTFPIE